jgi:hypothetical protein
MKKTLLWLLPLFITGILISGCSTKAKYEHKLKKEIASGIRNDSIFLGMYFGMTDKDFYTHCWELNRKGLLKQGSTNTTVEFLITHDLKYPCSMNFYPTFVKGRIAEMPVRFVYSGWAPWNKELTADKLQVDILNWYKKSFGDDFMEIEHPQKGKAFVNISGNRRISIFKEDDLHVWAVFTDMLVNKASADSAKMVSNPIDNIKESK